MATEVLELFICDTVLSVSCSLVVIYWEMADLLALLYVMFSCVFVTLPCYDLCQVWYLIESSPDFCLLPYFNWSSGFRGEDV